MYALYYKRIFDFCLSFIAIIVLSPLLLILIILGAINMKGNPFFTQLRPGKDEKIFKLIKFRTMTCKKDESGKLLQDDMRLTRYGKILRRTSFDELPEFINILKGDMSFIGPRPLLVRYLPYYTEKEKHRHDIRPGLTGLAQIEGRNFITWAKTFSYDLEYIEKCSFIFDIKIILSTVIKVLKKEGITDATQGTLDSSGNYVHDALDIERKERMKQEIGSNFCSNKLVKQKHIVDYKGFELYENKYYLKSGRNAIKAICLAENKRKKKALCPIYTCQTVIEPFIECGWDVSYFEVNEDLTINEKNLMKMINNYKPSIILVHSYFGFNTCSDKIGKLLGDARKKGIIVIEDITQSIFSSFNRLESDYYVSSLRKYFAIPDGGVIISRKKISIPILKSEKQIVEAFNSACMLKKKYLKNKDNIDKNGFREKYITLKKYIDNNSEIHKISDESYKILEQIDNNFIRKKRIHNYLILSKLLAQNNVVNLIIKKKTLENEVPLFLPVYLKNKEERDDVQSFLAKNDIYCPIIWPKPSMIINNKSKIYDKILCFPIDQRYGEEEMERINEVLMNYGRMKN